MISNFNAEDVRKEDMNLLADSIENYMINLKSVMIIPKEVTKEDKDKLKKGLEESEKLVKKLRKGDKSVFKEADEVENLFY